MDTHGMYDGWVVEWMENEWVKIGESMGGWLDVCVIGGLMTEWIGVAMNICTGGWWVDEWLDYVDEESIHNLNVFWFSYNGEVPSSSGDLFSVSIENKQW